MGLKISDLRKLFNDVVTKNIRNRIIQVETYMVFDAHRERALNYNGTQDSTKNVTQGPQEIEHLARERDFNLEDWYFPNTTRGDAERLLEVFNNSPGTFIIRNSETYNGFWSLSVLTYENQRGYKTRHYLIEKGQEGYYLLGLKNLKVFETLNDLVNYYKNNRYQQLKLSTPCVKYSDYINP